MNSKQKGNRGERELAKVLSEYGYECRRGQQYNGLDGEDVVGLDYIHIECKRVERLDLGASMYQARRDSKKDQLPAVFHRKNREDWKVTMELKDWIHLYNEYYSGMKLMEENKC
jgi:Holliday junction resolvase